MRRCTDWHEKFGPPRAREAAGPVAPAGGRAPDPAEGAAALRRDAPLRKAYVEITTDTPFEKGLGAYLQKRRRMY